MSIHVACLWICVLFSLSFVCLHMCAYACKFKVHCGNAFEPGASGLPYYCTPPVCQCVPAVLGALAVWRHNQKKTKKIDTERGTKRSEFSPWLVVNVVVVGPFEEEKEGISIASDVFKVEGEDLDTLGYLIGEEGCLRSRIVGMSPLARSWWNPRTVTVPWYRFNEIKQHTHSRLGEWHHLDMIYMWSLTRHCLSLAKL